MLCAAYLPVRIAHCEQASKLRVTRAADALIGHNQKLARLVQGITLAAAVPQYLALHTPTNLVRNSVSETHHAEQVPYLRDMGCW